MMTGAGVQGQINKQINQYFNQEGKSLSLYKRSVCKCFIIVGVDSDKYEGGEEVVAADKGDSEEVAEEHCEAGQEAAQPTPEQEAGAAN